MGEWHYKHAILRDAGSDNHFVNTSRGRVAAEGSDDHQLRRFRLGGLAHMQGTPVGTAEGGGDPALAGEDRAQAGPPLGDAVRLQAPPDDLDELIGQHGDEQVSLGALRRLMLDRAQTQLRF